MTYAYVVHGSEDGVFAVCGNKKRAIEKAKEYMKDCGTLRVTETTKNWFWHIESENEHDYTNATVEKFELE